MWAPPERSPSRLRQGESQDPPHPPPPPWPALHDSSRDPDAHTVRFLGALSFHGPCRHKSVCGLRCSRLCCCPPPAPLQDTTTAGREGAPAACAPHVLLPSLVTLRPCAPEVELWGLGSARPPCSLLGSFRTGPHPTPPWTPAPHAVCLSFVTAVFR